MKRDRKQRGRSDERQPRVLDDQRPQITTTTAGRGREVVQRGREVVQRGREVVQRGLPAVGRYLRP